MRRKCHHIEHDKNGYLCGGLLPVNRDSRQTFGRVSARQCCAGWPEDPKRENDCSLPLLNIPFVPISSQNRALSVRLGCRCLPVAGFILLSRLIRRITPFIACHPIRRRAALKM
jgi:hypothetical protein